MAAEPVSNQMPWYQTKEFKISLTVTIVTALLSVPHGTLAERGEFG